MDPEIRSREAAAPGTLWTWIGTLLIALAAVMMLYVGRDLLVPIALAVLIWFLINALAGALTRATGLSTGLAKTAAVLIFVVFALWSGSVVVDNLGRIAGDLDPSASPIVGGVLAAVGRLGILGEPTLETVFELYPLEDFLATALSVFRGLVGDASLVLLYVMFLLLDQRFFDAKMRALVPDRERRAAIKQTILAVSQEARIYLWLMFLISLGVGMATFAFCALFGVEGAAFWGFLAFGLNFIPTIGSILAVLIPCVYALLTFSDPVALGGLIACLAVTQFVAGEVVLPRVMGANLNLSSFVVLLALVVWGMLWGPVGMFLGIPITVMALVLCARFPRGRAVAILLSKDGRIERPEVPR